MTAKRRRPTQVDIARRVGISQATVSLVISGGAASDLVAEDTRRAVLEAAAELGYTVNTAARSLKGGRNRMLGLYTFESVFPVDQRDFYFPFLLGVEGAAAEFGYDLLLFSSASPEAGRRIYADGVNRLKVADGCVLLGRQLDRSEVAELIKEDFPFVFVGRREVPGVELPYVAADYIGATREMVRRLAQAGHRKLAYLKVTDDKEWTRDREAGFRQGLDEAGIAAADVPFIAIDEESPLTAVRLREWLAAGITAVVVEPSHDDSVIAAVERAATELGLSIPADLSVAVLGDPLLRDATVRDWSRFALPREEMGREAVRLLLQLFDDTATERQLYLDCTQIPGDSVAAPPGRPGA
ncbi:DNA-binding LacI/PurR family transcriptional regulator [Kribbella amoyensis]|uniref:DNA-binding LacI/PurR family transcriptional regulator n=1 Tax=Kribbella amoyensis TaxID=996641 RepID=A0A561BSU3_9ACTN|nr:LacI family DNA-binding transcriptional regulator [Kribbella amoyensis]TWD81954.1 DNA-binding LacI/PurR family transcriptional regulator [Kribbella amoyensis]